MPPLQTLTKDSVLLDGKTVDIDKAGRTNFSILKTGIAASIPLNYYAFDLFEKDGQDLTGLPLVELKVNLVQLIGNREPGDSLQYIQRVVKNGRAICPLADMRHDREKG